MDNLVLLKTYKTRLEAEIVKGKLEAYKIKSIILGDDEGGMSPFPFQPSSTGIKLLINKKDYKKARDLLNSDK